MRTKHIPGGIYADCLPNGARVASIGATVVKGWWEDEGTEIRPPVTMMFNRLGPSGEIASKSHSPGTVYTYNGAWIDTGIDSPGVQAHGWRPDGTLVILQAGADQESMGLRYFDLAQPPGGNLDRFAKTPGWATGSPTYTPDTAFARALGVSRLFEWTQLAPGIFVGQGDRGGTVIQHPRFGCRLLIDGDSRFVQGHYDGRTIAIAVSRLAQRDAWCFWLSEDEIGGLPVYPAVAPEPIPDPTPDPKPDLEPEPTPVPEIPNYYDHVARVFAQHGGDSDEAGAKVTRIVAYDVHHGLNGAPKDPRVGLYRKRSASTILDRDPDKLCFNLGGGDIAFVDIIAGAGAPGAKAGWGDPHFEHDADPGDFASWVAPEPEPGVHTGGDGGDPGDEDTHTPPPQVRPELKDVMQHITDAGSAALRAQKALAAVKWPEPEQHECPPPPPCPLPHGAELQPYEAVLEMGRQIDLAVDLRKLGGEAFAHLMARFYGRSHTAEQIVEEARLRARGEWEEQW